MFENAGKAATEQAFLQTETVGMLGSREWVQNSQLKNQVKGWWKSSVLASTFQLYTSEQRLFHVSARIVWRGEWVIILLTVLGGYG